MSGDDLTFEEMMAMTGVRSYDGSKGPAPSKPPPPPSGPTAAPAPPPRPAPALPSAALTAARAEVASLTTQLAAARNDVAAAEARATTAEGHTEEAEERIRVLVAERDGVDRKRRSLSDELTETRTQLLAVTASSGLEATLRERGLGSRDEDIEALLGLLDVRADQLIEAIELASPDQFAALLDERVALVCGRDSCLPDGPTASVTVQARRCEICGGSDIRAAFATFADACASKGVKNVVVVGGSPAYRKQLGALADAHPDLRMDLVLGTVRRPTHKAEADMRRADVVVIWGATLLDHSISENYKAGTGKARLMTVRDRGITRMLSAVRRYVAG
ncbi:MAG: hypothetical protein GY898_28700 [Proteobacteria bacterium]|nr:hypothetical protein [Pseudomonadota bacterium]